MVCTSYQVTPLTLLPVSTVAGTETSYSYSVFLAEREETFVFEGRKKTGRNDTQVQEPHKHGTTGVNRKIVVGGGGQLLGAFVTAHAMRLSKKQENKKIEGGQAGTKAEG